MEANTNGKGGCCGGGDGKPRSLKEALAAALASGAILGALVEVPAPRFVDGVSGVHPETYRRIMQGGGTFTAVEQELARQTFHESQSETECLIVKALACDDAQGAATRAQLAAAYPRLAEVAALVGDQDGPDSAYARWCRKVDGLNRMTIASLPLQEGATAAKPTEQRSARPDPSSN